MTAPAAAFSLYRKSARSVGAKSAVGLAAGAAALAAAGSARAQAIAYTFSSGNVGTLDGSRLYLDFAHGTVSSTIGPIGGIDDEFEIIFGRNDPTYGDGLVSRIQGFGFTHGHIQFYQTGNYYVPVKLERGDKVGAGTMVYAEFNTYGSTGAAPAWANVHGGYVGVNFRLNPNDNSNVYYGWIKVDTDEDAMTVTVEAFGYNQTPFAASFAGDGLPSPVPEPASEAALLAAGAAGLALYRQRKGKARAAAVAA